MTTTKLTDILERLRFGDLPDWKTLVDLAKDAADEIERLKIALKAVRLHIALTDSESTLLPMIDAALSQKEGDMGEAQNSARREAYEKAAKVAETLDYPKGRNSRIAAAIRRLSEEDQ